MLVVFAIYVNCPNIVWNFVSYLLQQKTFPAAPTAKHNVILSR